MKIRLIVAAVLSAVALSGCGILGPASMSPEQMAQNAKDKNAVVGCTYGLGMYGQGAAVYIDTNKINDNQSISVGEKCITTVTGTKGQGTGVGLGPK